MRDVAILYLEPDKAVASFLAGLRAEPISWHEVAAVPFGGEPSSLAQAVKSLSHKSGEFDTLLIVSHGLEDDEGSDDEIQFQARTTVDGEVTHSNAYLLAEELEPVLNEGVALVAAICFSSHEDFRGAMKRLLPAVAIAGVGRVNVPNAVKAILAFFRMSQSFGIEKLPQIHGEIVESVRGTSGGQMEAWLPGTDR